MKKRVINPWTWQKERSYHQAIEVLNPTATLYVSGQAAINDKGVSSKADMATQLIIAINNLEHVILEAGFATENIVKLNVYATSTKELWPHFNILQEWIETNKMEIALTYLEVASLFETLKVELEATVIK